MAGYFDNRTDSDALTRYFRDTRRFKLLTREEEHELAVAVNAGDTAARARMIEANLRLVVSVAKRYQNRGLSLPDLIGEGNVGLIRAAEPGSFDPDAGTRFSTYATYWIKQTIRLAILNTAQAIRFPVYMVALLAQGRETERALTERLGYVPTADQIVAWLDLSKTKRSRLKAALGIRQPILEVDGGFVLRELGESHDYLDQLPADVESPDKAAELNDSRRDLERRLSRLDARSRRVLVMRYGLDGDGERTLEEVGQYLGITRERVRQLQKKAMTRLKAGVEPEPSLRACVA